MLTRAGGYLFFGILFLIVFFTVGGVFGPLNDIAVIVQYNLILPIAIKVYRLVRPYGPILSQIATLIGIAGMLAVIILQTLLVAGVLPFSQQIRMRIITSFSETIIRVPYNTGYSSM
ncbi:hypothetical protein ACFLV7_06220 [Chloroflexota bacterium]